MKKADDQEKEYLKAEAERLKAEKQPSKDPSKPLVSFGGDGTPVYRELV